MLLADGGICKAYSRSDDFGLTWSGVNYFGEVRSGSCEAGVLADPQWPNGLFVSVGDSDAPPNTGRMRMMLHYSSEGGDPGSWRELLLLDANRSAYSQLIALSSRPGYVGVLWEALSPDEWFIGEMRLQWVPVPVPGLESTPGPTPALGPGPVSVATSEAADTRGVRTPSTRWTA